MAEIDHKTFKALAHPVRREVLTLLGEKEVAAGELADRFSLSASTMSGHFRVLLEAGVVTSRREGTSIMYALNYQALSNALNRFLDRCGGRVS